MGLKRNSSLSWIRRCSSVTSSESKPISRKAVVGGSFSRFKRSAACPIVSLISAISHFDSNVTRSFLTNGLNNSTACARDLKIWFPEVRFAPPLFFPNESDMMRRNSIFSNLANTLPASSKTRMVTNTPRPFASALILNLDRAHRPSTKRMRKNGKWSNSLSWKQSKSAANDLYISIDGKPS